MSEIVIHCEGISKQYRIGRREPYRSLRDVIAGAAKAPFRRRSDSEAGTATFWALEDVSFAVRRGEVVGVVGRNGAGKSTLLKVLSKITAPTRGHAEVRGRVGSLLEVGTGFHPELTGRENVYLNGAILGMRRAEITAKFDEIIAFAEVDRFVDTPVKHYSSGMATRLAFAVAAHLDVDIMIIDEVLAVGDAAFQKRCMGKMSDLAHEGRTLLFVTHQLNQIRRLCQRAMWLNNGRVETVGNAASVVAAYEASTLRQPGGDSLDSHRQASFLGWSVPDANGGSCELTSSGPANVQFDLEVRSPVQNGHIGAALYNDSDQLIWGNGVDDVALSPGSYAILLDFSSLPIRPGAYYFLVTLFSEGRLVEKWFSQPPLIVMTQPLGHKMDEWAGVLNVAQRFTIERRP